MTSKNLNGQQQNSETTGILAQLFVVCKLTF